MRDHAVAVLVDPFGQRVGVERRAVLRRQVRGDLVQVQGLRAERQRLLVGAADARAVAADVGLQGGEQRVDVGRRAALHDHAGQRGEQVAAVGVGARIERAERAGRRGEHDAERGQHLALGLRARIGEGEAVDVDQRVDARVGERGEHVRVQHRLGLEVGVGLQRDRAVGERAGDLVQVAADGRHAQQGRSELGVGHEGAGGRRAVRVEVAGGRQVEPELARGDGGTGRQRPLLRHAGAGRVGGGRRHRRRVALRRPATAGGEQHRRGERKCGERGGLQAAKWHGAADSLAGGWTVTPARGGESSWIYASHAASVNGRCQVSPVARRRWRRASPRVRRRRPRSGAAGACARRCASTKPCPLRRPG